MKNVQSCTPKKYQSSGYQPVEEGIYLAKSPYWDEDIYVTSLFFEMEPDCYGEEGGSPQNITQVPFESILDEFYVCVTDFYEPLNQTSATICYQEFGSSQLSDLRELRTLLGKRFYAVPYIDPEEQEKYYHIKIE